MVLVVVAPEVIATPCSTAVGDPDVVRLSPIREGGYVHPSKRLRLSENHACNTPVVAAQLCRCLSLMVAEKFNLPPHDGSTRSIFKNIHEICPDFFNLWRGDGTNVGVVRISPRVILKVSFGVKEISKRL